MSVKENAIVTVSYENDALVLSDNEGNPFDPKNPEAFTTLVKPNGKIGWQAGEGISSLEEIKIDEGSGIFKKLPSEKNGVWEAKIDDKHSGGAKYSILYKVEGGDQVLTLDPRIDIKYP